MKNIELTEDHKAKLLKICKVLFPENNISFTDDYYCEWSLFLVSDDYDNEINIEDKIEIHWFEFCMTHLINKLELEYASIIVLTENHPIDYLYEEFKKLK